MRCEPQLIYGAEHTFGNGTAELACCYFNAMCELCHHFFSLGRHCHGNISSLKNIFCGCYYLEHARAHVHLTDDKAFRIRMLFYLLDKTDADVFYFISDVLIALDLGARVRHSVAIFLDIYI